MIRFIGTTYRCPDAPYMIMDKRKNEKTILKFKHEELPYGYDTLNKICDFLNYMDDELTLMVDDLIQLRKDGGEFEYNHTKLEQIRVKYEDEINKLRLEKRRLEREITDLIKDNHDLKEEKQGLIKLLEMEL